MKTTCKCLLIIFLLFPAWSIQAATKVNTPAKGVVKRSLPFYAEAGVGYAYTYYRQFAPAVPRVAEHLHNGFSKTVGAGYTVYPHLSLEAGATQFPTSGIWSSRAGNGEVKSWYAYHAVKIDADMRVLPVDAYFKGGIAYRSVQVKADLEGFTGSYHYWAPFLGAGIARDINRRLYAAVEYAYVGDDWNDILKRNIPGIGTIGLKLGIRI